MTNKQEIALVEEIDRLNERIIDLEDELGHLEHVNDKMTTKLKKAIKIHKVKSIEFKEKGEIQNSMIFNRIATILESVLNEVVE